MADEYKFIATECRRGIAFIGLNRPEARNALNYGILAEIVRACQAADENPEVNVIVIHSLVKGAFSAGADLKERTGMTDEQVKKRRVYAKQCYAQLEQIEKPMIAAVDGKVIGGGGEISGCCDFILGSDRSTYRYTEVTVGSVGATQRVTRFIGRQRAKELLFTGREIDSEEAWRIGLIARRLPHENFMEQVEEIAATVASRSPVSLAVTKKAINMAAEAAPEHGVLVEQLAIELNIAKGQWRQGLAGFHGERKDLSGK